MKVKIFGKNGCAKCLATKNKFEFFISKWDFGDRIKILFHDMDTVEGMAEGAYYDVLHIPTTVLEKDNVSIARWEGQVPESEDFRPHLEAVQR